MDAVGVDEAVAGPAGVGHGGGIGDAAAVRDVLVDLDGQRGRRVVDDADGAGVGGVGQVVERRDLEGVGAFHTRWRAARVEVEGEETAVAAGGRDRAIEEDAAVGDAARVGDEGRNRDRHRGPRVRRRVGRHRDDRPAVIEEDRLRAALLVLGLARAGQGRGERVVGFEGEIEGGGAVLRRCRPRKTKAIRVRRARRSRMRAGAGLAGNAETDAGPADAGCVGDRGLDRDCPGAWSEEKVAGAVVEGGGREANAAERWRVAVDLDQLLRIARERGRVAGRVAGRDLELHACARGGDRIVDQNREGVDARFGGRRDRRVAGDQQRDGRILHARAGAVGDRGGHDRRLPGGHERRPSVALHGDHRRVLIDDERQRIAARRPRRRSQHRLQRGRAVGDGGQGEAGGIRRRIGRRLRSRCGGDDGAAAGKIEAHAGDAARRVRAGPDGQRPVGERARSRAGDGDAGSADHDADALVEVARRAVRAVGILCARAEVRRAAGHERTDEDQDEGCAHGQKAKVMRAVAASSTPETANKVLAVRAALLPELSALMSAVR